MKRAFAGVLITIIALFLLVDRGRSQATAEPNLPIEVQMRNVNLHLDQFLILEIRSLRGQRIAPLRTPPARLSGMVTPKRRTGNVV